MPRAKRGFKARRRRNRILKHAEGFYSARSRIFGDAVEAVRNAWQYAYIGRRLRRRDFRRLWITRINAAARTAGTTYSRLIPGLKKANVILDRKILSELAVSDPSAFAEVVRVAKGLARRAHHAIAPRPNVAGRFAFSAGQRAPGALRYPTN